MGLKRTLKVCGWCLESVLNVSGKCTEGINLGQVSQDQVVTGQVGTGQVGIGQVGTGQV